MAAAAGPSDDEKKLYDIWSRLVHIDVHKDHGPNYDENIVNGFLPYTKYKTNTFDLSLGQTISRQLRGLVMDKDSLFNSVVSGTSLADLNNTDIGGEGTLSNLPGGNSYDFKVWEVAYEQTGANTQASEIQEFMGRENKFAAFVDTSNKIEKLIGATPADTLNIIYAYTAAVQNDPADKMHKLSVKSKLEDTNYKNFLSNYYLEDTTNISKGGKSVIVYPPFDPTKPLGTQTGLSHFMCKFPVYLELYKSDDPNKKGTLNTKLIYTRHDEIREGVKREGSERTVVIHPGGNIATKKGGVSSSSSETGLISISPLSSFIKKCFGMKEFDIKKEAIFISKHHGDIAQVLEMHRNVILTGGRSTIDLKSCFVSIDLIPIIKAFTEGIDFVFYYINSSSKLFVFKNKKLENPKERLRSLMNETKNVISSLQKDVEKYIDKMTEINIIRKVFYDKVEHIFTTSGAGVEDQLKKYVNIIRYGFQISTLIQFIPKEELVRENYTQVQNSLKGIEQKFEASITPEILTEILTTINEAKKLLQIPTSYLDLEVVFVDGKKPFVDGKKPLVDETDMTKVTLQETEIERVLVKFLGPSSSRNTIALKNILSTINLNKLTRVVDYKNIDIRTSTKLQNNWGTDFIFYIYDILKDYENLGALFCKSLYSVLEVDKQPYFVSALKITGISFTPAPPSAQTVTGGYPKGTYKKSRRSKNLTYKSKRVLQQSGGASLTEDEEKELIENEIEDTELVIELYEKFIEIVNERPEDKEESVKSSEGVKEAEAAAAARAAVVEAEAAVRAEVEKFGTTNIPGEPGQPPGTPPGKLSAMQEGVLTPRNKTTGPQSADSTFTLGGNGYNTKTQGGGALTREELTKINRVMNEFSKILVEYEIPKEEISEDIDITREDYFQCECIHARFAINYPQFEVMKQILIKFMQQPLLQTKVVGLLDRIEKLQTGDESKPYETESGITPQEPKKPLGKRLRGESEPPSPVSYVGSVARKGSVANNEGGSSGSEYGNGGHLPRPPPPFRVGGSKTLKINKKIQQRSSNYSSQTAKHKR